MVYYNHPLSNQNLSKLTDCYEGSLLRSIRRLQELLRQLVLAAGLMGNGDLQAKFSAALDSIWRGNDTYFRHQSEFS
jgi:ATP-dependent RNA helicase DOB1